MKYCIGASLSLAVMSTGVVADSSMLEEVIVTAQKREQNLQDVPISVAAFSGDMLEKLGMQDPTDVAKQVPNVQFNDQGTTPQFNIRGVQLNDFGDGNEAPVGFYVDEVYLGTLAKIKVLKGLIEYAKSYEDVWFGTHRDAAAYFRQQLDADK